MVRWTERSHNGRTILWWCGWHVEAKFSSSSHF
uniref:Uncharacterized protein n=1 Tax=Anguilla anguilla TaxID=7936 RepID=A0A0E9PZA7_ANGAN